MSLQELGIEIRVKGEGTVYGGRKGGVGGVGGITYYECVTEAWRDFCVCLKWLSDLFR